MTCEVEKSTGHSRIAQLAERLTVNQNVAGSSPAAGAGKARKSEKPQTESV